MAKDYAKQFSNKKQGRNWFVDFLLVLALFLLVSGLIYAAYAHKNPSAVKFPINEWVVRIKSAFSHKKAIVPTQPPAVKEEASSEPSVRFDFYTELPAMQVGAKSGSIRLREEAKVDFPPSPAEHYFLELAVFKTESEASQARLSLLLAGIEADVVKAASKDQSIYRLQQGDYTDKKSAKTAQLALQQKGISAVIRKANTA